MSNATHLGLTPSPGDGEPLIRYDITALNETPLLEAVAGFGVTTAPHANNRCSDVAATLEDDIIWESHVDQADRLDYVVSVSSGVLAGLIDTFFVGELSLERARNWGKDQIEQMVMKVARAEGYNGNDLSAAIRRLERNHPFVSDGLANDFGGGLQHHLRDFSHHFSIGGLFFSMFTQFTCLVVGTDQAGTLHVVPVPDSHRDCIGKNFQEKIVFATIGWFFHMVSDMAGSSGSLMGGTGIPGPLVSFMKELSALPFFKDSGDGDMGFRLWVTKLFNGTLLAGHDENGRIIKDSVRKFDLRTEIGMLGEIGRQAIPVLINQCVVRGFYFCRRTFREIRNLDIHSVGELDRIAPEDVLPWGTPAMLRMITVSSGAFAWVDISDAAVRAVKSQNPVTFFLHVNYVGVATFVIACTVDVKAILADKALEGDEDPEKVYERKVAKLECLELDSGQMRMLHSLMYNMVAYDIERERHDKRRSRKRLWLDEWSDRIAEIVGLSWSDVASYFMDDRMLYQEMNGHLGFGDISWIWLIALEASCFKAYMPLHGEHDGEYKGLRVSTAYLDDVFCKRQPVINRKELKQLTKTLEGTRDRLDNAGAKKAAGAAGTVVVAAATGGLAFYFAPALAPTLAAALGAEVTALHGAALTSASLAFLGGGSLAAGGAGMAGGAMFIAGGGALIGAVGAPGISTVASMALATDGGYVLEECAKLITFSRLVLTERYGDYAAVSKIYEGLNGKILELEMQVEAIINRDNDSSTARVNVAENELSPRQMIRVLKRSLKYMSKCRSALEKLLASALPTVEVP